MFGKIEQIFGIEFVTEILGEIIFKIAFPQVDRIGEIDLIVPEIDDGNELFKRERKTLAVICDRKIRGADLQRLPVSFARCSCGAETSETDVFVPEGKGASVGCLFVLFECFVDAGQFHAKCSLHLFIYSVSKAEKNINILYVSFQKYAIFNVWQNHPTRN